MKNLNDQMAITDNQFISLKDQYTLKIEAIEKLEKKYKLLKNKQNKIEKHSSNIETNSLEVQQQNIEYKKQMRQIEMERKSFKTEMRKHIRTIEDKLLTVQKKNVQLKNRIKELEKDILKQQDMQKSINRVALLEEDLRMIQFKLTRSEDVRKSMEQTNQNLKSEMTVLQDKLLIKTKQYNNLNERFNKEYREMIKSIKTNPNLKEKNAISFLISEYEKRFHLAQKDLLELQNKVKKNEQMYNDLTMNYNSNQEKINQITIDKKKWIQRYIQSLKPSSNHNPQVVSLAQLLDNVKQGSNDEKIKAIIMLGEIADTRSIPVLDSVLRDNYPIWLKDLAQETLKVIERKVA